MYDIVVLKKGTSDSGSVAGMVYDDTCHELL